MMADDQALQMGPFNHLFGGSRGRIQAIAPYQLHGFTGYEPNRRTSMPSTPRRAGEALGPPPRMVVPPKAGMPSSGSGTQAPTYQTWRMLAEVVHLHLGDEEASRERYMYEQQETIHAAHLQENERRELEQIAGSLRSEMTVQAEQYLNHYVHEEQTYLTFHLRNVESHLQTEMANTILRLQQEY